MPLTGDFRIVCGFFHLSGRRQHRCHMAPRWIRGLDRENLEWNGNHLVLIEFLKLIEADMTIEILVELLDDKHDAALANEQSSSRRTW